MLKNRQKRNEFLIPRQSGKTIRLTKEQIKKAEEEIRKGKKLFLLKTNLC